MACATPGTAPLAQERSDTVRLTPPGPSYTPKDRLFPVRPPAC